MQTIHTLLGCIKPDELGFCQPHEHLAITKGVSSIQNPALFIDDIEKTTKEMLRYVSAGGKALVDAQPGGCNRNINQLVFLSRTANVHIIASTGFHKLIFYPENHWLYKLSSRELSRIFVNELNVGMYLNLDDSFHEAQTSYRAGIIKTALDSTNLNTVYPKLFTAAAEASLKTGCPIMIHVEKGSDPVTLLHFLRSQSVLPSKLIFCHMDRAIPDLNVHKTIASYGAYLEYDTIGRFKYHSDDTEISILQNMISSGYHKQLLLSLDTTAERLKAYNPKGIGLDYLFTSFIPQMRSSGIVEEDIYQMTTLNCARALTWDA